MFSEKIPSYAGGLLKSRPIAAWTSYRTGQKPQSGREAAPLRHVTGTPGCTPAAWALKKAYDAIVPRYDLMEQGAIDVIPSKVQPQNPERKDDKVMYRQR